MAAQMEQMMGMMVQAQTAFAAQAATAGVNQNAEQSPHCKAKEVNRSSQEQTRTICKSWLHNRLPSAQTMTPTPQRSGPGSTIPTGLEKQAGAACLAVAAESSPSSWPAALRPPRRPPLTSPSTDGVSIVLLFCFLSQTWHGGLPS